MHKIRWFAFVPALILAPVVLGASALVIVALTASITAGHNPISMIAFVTFFATFWGAPTYLTFGAAGFIYGLKRWDDDAPLWLIGFAANLVSAPAVLVVIWLAGSHDPLEVTAFVTGFGCIFAPIWGAIFGWIYRAFVRKGNALREAAHGPL